MNKALYLMGIAGTMLATNFGATADCPKVLPKAVLDHLKEDGTRYTVDQNVFDLKFPNYAILKSTFLPHLDKYHTDKINLKETHGKVCFYEVNPKETAFGLKSFGLRFEVTATKDTEKLK
jgi:hypothetical protein